MDNPWWVAISAGLTASLVTAVVNTFTNFRLAQRQQRNELERRYFDKKLAAAEMATTQYTILLSVLTNLSILFGRLKDKDEGTDFDDMIDDNLQAQAIEQFKQVNSSSSAFAVSLYFDLGPISELPTRINEIVTILSSLGKAFNIYISATDQYSSDPDSPYHHLFQKEYTNAKTEFVTQVNTFTGKVDEYSKLINQAMDKLKKDMRFYEVKPATKIFGSLT